MISSVKGSFPGVALTAAFARLTRDTSNPRTTSAVAATSGTNSWVFVCHRRPSDRVRGVLSPHTTVPGAPRVLIVPFGNVRCPEAPRRARTARRTFADALYTTAHTRSPVARRSPPLRPPLRPNASSSETWERNRETAPPRRTWLRYALHLL